MARKYLSPLNLLNLTSDPGSATEGDFYWNSSTNRLRIYFDGAWADVSSNTAFTNAANTFTTGPQTINTGGASTVGLILKGDASQTANLQEWYNASNALISWVRRDGLIAGSIQSPTVYKATVVPNSASEIPLIARGFASQSANLTEWQDSTPTTMLSVSSSGDLTSAGNRSVRFSYHQNVGGTGAYLDFATVSNSATILQRVTTAVGLIVRGAASQTADLIQAQTSAGSVVFKVSPTGVINAGGTTTIGNVLTFSDPGVATETRFNFTRTSAAEIISNGDLIIMKHHLMDGCRFKCLGILQDLWHQVMPCMVIFLYHLTLHMQQ